MDEFEVFFCDLCGTSVPATDLQASRAVRLHDKIVGSCCVEDLRPRESERGVSYGGPLIGMLAVLVAVAGATIFLDWRLNEEAIRSERSIERLDAKFDSQVSRLSGMESLLSATASRSDFEDIDAKSESLRKAIGSVDERIARSVSVADSKLQDLMEEFGALRRRIDIQTARISDLNEQSMRISGDMAELKSLPRFAAPASDDDDSRSARPALSDERMSLPKEITQLLPTLSDSDAGSRFEAVDELLQTGDSRIYSHIIPLATDPDPFVRRLVVEGLAGHRADPAVDILLLALGDQESLVRHTASTSLKKLTGQNIPFDAEGSVDQRASMQRRWQQWWAKNKVEFF